MIHNTHRWGISERKAWLQCVSNGVMSLLHTGMSETVCQSVYLFKYPSAFLEGWGMGAWIDRGKSAHQQLSSRLSSRLKSYCLISQCYTKSWIWNPVHSLLYRFQIIRQSALLNRIKQSLNIYRWIATKYYVETTLRCRFHIIMTLVSRHVSVSEVLTYHISLFCKSWYK